jgi:hypothetical protein
LILSKINQMKKLLIILSVFTIACSEPNFPIEDIGVSGYVADSVVVPYASLTGYYTSTITSPIGGNPATYWYLLRNQQRGEERHFSPTTGHAKAEKFLAYFYEISRSGLVFNYTSYLPSDKKIDSIFLYLYVTSFSSGSGIVICDAPLLWCQEVEVGIWDEVFDYTFAATGGPYDTNPYWKAYYEVIGYKSPITGTGYWRIRLNYLPGSRYGSMLSALGICEYAHDYVGTTPDGQYDVEFNLSSETNKPQLVIYYSDPPPSNTQKSTIIGVI